MSLQSFVVLARRNKSLWIVAAVLLFSTLLWVRTVAPWLLRLSSDFSFGADIVSVDDFYNEERQEYSGKIFSKTRYSYQTIDAVEDRSVIKNSFSVTTPDGAPIFSVDRQYGIDRYAMTHTQELGDRERDGYLFAPRNLDHGEPFTYWHVNYDGPAHMDFVDVEELYGLKVYRYETHYEGVRIDQTNNLGHLPGVGETRGVELEPYLQLWVEPVTGRMIKYADDTTAYYYDLETGERLHPWNHFANRFHERSVESIVELVRLQKNKQQIVEQYVPFIGVLTALFLLVRAGGLVDYFGRHVQEKWIALLGGGAVVSVATASLLGWVFSVEFLTHLGFRSSAMNPLTALCFMVLGVGIVFFRGESKNVRSACGFILIGIGLVRIFGLLGLIDFNIDLIFFGDTIKNYPIPARMATYTAVSFVLMGLILAGTALTAFNRLRFVEIMSSIVAMFSTLALTGHLFEALLLLNTPVFFSTAAHTAVLFLAGSVLLYALFRDRSELRLSGWLSVAGILAVSTTGTVVLTTLLERNFVETARSSFQTEIDQITDNITDRLNIYVSVLEGGRGLFSASNSVERSEWKAYVESLRLQRNYPGIQGVGYAAFVQPEDLAAHIDAIRAEGFPEFTVHPEGQRDIYSSIIYLEPFDKRNQQAFGFDMFQEPTRRAAMEQARDTGQPKISGRITLVQEIDDDVQPGFLIYVPFYVNGQPHGTIEQKQANIVGYVYSPFRARDFVEGAIGIGGVEHIGLAINDGAAPDSDSELYNDAPLKLHGQTPRFTQSKTIYVAGRAWTLTFHSESDYGATFLSRLAPLAMIALGAVVSVSAASAFYILLASRHRAVEYADKATQDLRSAKRLLEEQLHESERINALMVGRELKMRSLKKELKRHKNSAGKKEKKRNAKDS